MYLARYDERNAKCRRTSGRRTDDTGRALLSLSRHRMDSQFANWDDSFILPYVYPPLAYPKRIPVHVQVLTTSKSANLSKALTMDIKMNNKLHKQYLDLFQQGLRRNPSGPLPGHFLGRTLAVFLVPSSWLSNTTDIVRSLEKDA